VSAPELMDIRTLSKSFTQIAALSGNSFNILAERAHEMGIRLALGASRASVLRPVLGQSLSLTLAGIGWASRDRWSCPG
jgi:ABC-type antimicrobial peptide transport system permease subunit